MTLSTLFRTTSIGGIGWFLLCAELTFAAVPPPNDNLSGATVIPNVPYTTAPQSVAAATVEANEAVSNCGGSTTDSVWYQYTPTSDQDIAVDTFGANYDTVLSVWIGATHPLTELACNDDSNGQLSFLYLSVSAGTTYYIKIANYTGTTDATGSLTLNVNPIVRASNDNLANATVITTLPYKSKQAVQLATQEALEISASCNYGEEHDNSVWYQYTPTSDQIIALERTLLWFSEGLENVNDYWDERTMIVSVWNGTNHPLTELSCHRFEGNDHAPFLLSLTAGTTYYLKITSVSGVLDFLLSAYLVTPPKNDHLANATIIPTLPFNNPSQSLLGNSQEELVDGTSNCYGGNGSVWYQYTPGQTQTVKFNGRAVAGVNFGLSVWSRLPDSLTELTCNMNQDSILATTATQVLKLLAGTTYYIRISADNSQKNLISLTAEEVVSPSNDDVVNATVITSLPYNYFQNTLWATIEPGEIESSCRQWSPPSLHSVWYQYTPDRDQLMEFDTLGSNYDTILSVWTGTPPSLTELTCNDDDYEYDKTSSRLTLKLTAYTTYYIRVDTNNLNEQDGDLLSFYAQEMVSPANDNLAQAIPITSLPYTTLQHTQAASQEEGEVIASCANSTEGSVWYQYTPSQPQTITLDTLNSSYDTVLSVWTGEAHPLTEIACHNDLGWETNTAKLTVAMTPGTRYYINISGTDYYGEQFGTLRLTVTDQPFQLTALGLPTTMDALGNPVTTTSEFFGGISVNDSTYQPQVVENLSDNVEIVGKIIVDPKHVGQPAEMVVYAVYQPSAVATEKYFYMVHDLYWVSLWQGNLAGLMALQRVTLAPEQWLFLYRGRLKVPGVLDLFWGYRLADGTLVTNSQGLRVMINREISPY